MQGDEPKDFVNIALGKSAIQSSLSPWSTDGESSLAVQSSYEGDFAFHTDKDKRPFWELDLGTIYPIDRIVLHNRVSMLQERARKVRVEVGIDRDQWVLIHAGDVRFGAEKNGLPLMLNVWGDMDARFIRVSLDESEYLHLSRVEVWSDPSKWALSKFLVSHGLQNLKSDLTAGRYRVVANPAADWEKINGLTIDRSGRFGNLLIQYVNAILIAKRAGLKYVRFGQHELLDPKAALCVDGLILLPASHPLPVDGLFLEGDFFNADLFSPLLKPLLHFDAEEEVVWTSVFQTYLNSKVFTGLHASEETQPRDELTIHIRAGDIFVGDDGVGYGYRQPPLSFYILVITRMRQQGISRVRLVFEDRKNPCVDALIDWIGREAIEYRLQSASLKSDVSALVNAPHLVFGHGTFGYAMSRLSSHIETLHYFAPELGGSYRAIPIVDKVYEVSDPSGHYIKAYEHGKPFASHEGWRNTPEMRNLMLTYPIENLTISQVRPRAVDVADFARDEEIVQAEGSTSTLAKVE